MKSPLRFFAALAVSTLLLTSVHARSAKEVQPLLIGQSVPKVAISDEKGVAQYLPSLIRGQHTIVIFYRGGWCPYCNTHLQELAQIEPELIKLGYQIIAISPDSPEHLSSIEKDGDLAYRLFSDSSLEAAEAFGIDFTLDKGTLLKYKTFGINLKESSGGLNKDRLPVPSVFIVSPKNEIEFSYTNPDITKRVPGKLLLAAAEALK